jgi:creatinine amidohydrolase
MMPTATEIEGLLTFTLRRLSDLGVAQAVLFTGHFADEQLAMIERIATDWNATGQTPHLRALSVNQAQIAGFPPDHAGLFETTLLQGIDPSLVDLAQLGRATDDINRFDRASPLWGIVGADPRQKPTIPAVALSSVLVGWLTASVG